MVGHVYIMHSKIKKGLKTGLVSSDVDGQRGCAWCKLLISSCAFFVDAFSTFHGVANEPCHTFFSCPALLFHGIITDMWPTEEFCNNLDWNNGFLPRNMKFLEVTKLHGVGFESYANPMFDCYNDGIWAPLRPLCGMTPSLRWHLTFLSKSTSET